MKTRFTRAFLKPLLLCTLFLTMVLSFRNASAFCGFYVAKADASLFNTTSQVILVRDGDRTVITMSSDFQGDVKDFAMVVPVPVVLKREQIRTVVAEIFKKLDDYSSPRLVEYWDPNPCEPVYLLNADMALESVREQTTTAGIKMDSDKKYSVKIEAQYTVDEYDILILSATESSGLERWLTDNGYKIPEGAKEVLEPYINSNMKFFVVKVNMEELKKKGTKFLSPLQISFSSPKFMLPIRLGMANAKGPQDMIVYAFTKTGRVETTNYRTVKVPSNNNIPEFVQEHFGKFYVDTYRKHRKETGQNNVFLEYAWNISSYVSQFCDPCNGPPPMLQDMMTCGIDWVQNYHGGYEGNVFFTRLHVTYDRKNFPQDLFFEETPNQENFQARYVITHPSYGDYDCEAGKKYVKDVLKRRYDELNNLAILTGWDISGYGGYTSKFEQYVPEEKPQYLEPKNQPEKQIDQPDKSQSLPGEEDTMQIEQGSFTAPFYDDDNDQNNPASGDLKIILTGIMLLLVVFTFLARTGKQTPKSPIAKN